MIHLLKEEINMLLFSEAALKVLRVSDFGERTRENPKNKNRIPAQHLLLINWNRFRLTTIPGAICVDRTRDYSGGISL